MSNNFWDINFSQPGYKYGVAPNAFLADQAYRLPAGSHVLVPGDGEGRNGVWLAGQGHQVTAVDMSEVGLSKMRALAVERGVEVRTIHADLVAWEPSNSYYDAVVLIFVHLPSAIRALVHRKLLSALRPGGLLILEAFGPQQLQYQSGGPKDLDMLYTQELLAHDFGSMATELMAATTVSVLNEGPGHQGPGYVVHGVWEKS